MSTLVNIKELVVDLWLFNFNFQNVLKLGNNVFDLSALIQIIYPFLLLFWILIPSTAINKQLNLLSNQNDTDNESNNETIDVIRQL